jgi:hypothetical protein
MSGPYGDGKNPHDGLWEMPVQAAAPVPVPIDEGQVRQALGVFVDPAYHVQIQALPSGKWRHCAGADLDGLVRTVAEFANEKGVYFSLNPYRGPLDRALRNTDILCRRWFLIDPDARKDQTDSSTTDEEKECARQVTEAIRDFLKARGWPDPAYVDSGNNWQLLYRIDLPNDKLSQQLLSRALKTLGEKFDTERVKIDRAVHDAKRICKIPGTMVRKGIATPERPWRQARCMSIPMHVLTEIVPVDRIKELAKLGGAKPAEPEAPLYEAEKEVDSWLLTIGRSDDRKAYAQAALEREIGKVATAQAPGRNRTLYISALKLGTLVACDLLDEYEVKQQLWQAARACGLGEDGDPHEVQRAIQNGFTFGVQNPRQIPDRGQKKTSKATENANPEAPVKEPLVIQASQVVSRPVDWLWTNRVPRGFISVFAGRTGLGKSFVTLDIAARVTRGDVWPDSKSECAPLGNVLLISEDPFEYVLTPRLIELEADLDRVFFMTWAAMARYTLSNTEMLGQAAGMAGDPILIVIDPPTNFLGDSDEHKNVEVRQTLMHLVSWINSRPSPVAVILITHVNKQVGKGVDALSRVIGSVAWVTTARIAHMFMPSPDDPEKLGFLPAKSNLGSLPEGLAYKITKTETFAKVEWLGVADFTADEGVSGEKKKPRGVVATEWLADQFRKQREWLSDEIMANAREAGISRNAMFSPQVNGLPIKKIQHFRADGSRYWSWTAQPGWPPEVTIPEPENGKRDSGILGFYEPNPLQDNTHNRVPKSESDRDSEKTGILTGTLPQNPGPGQSPDGRDSVNLNGDKDLESQNPRIPESRKDGIVDRDSEKKPLIARVDIALQVLVGMLSARDTPFLRVIECAAELGVSMDAIFKAAKQLKVIRFKVDGQEVWSLEERQV